MQDLRGQVEISSVFQVLVEVEPDAILLLSPDERARILFAKYQCGHLLLLDSAIPKGQALVGRSLWDWTDTQDKAAVVAAIGVCLYRKDATRQGALPPPLPFRVAATSGDAAAGPRVAMQQQGHQEPPQDYQLQQQETIRATLTFRSSERGLVVFDRGGLALTSCLCNCVAQAG